MSSISGRRPSDRLLILQEYHFHPGIPIKAGSFEVERYPGLQNNSPKHPGATQVEDTPSLHSNLWPTKCSNKLRDSNIYHKSILIMILIHYTKCNILNSRKIISNDLVYEWKYWTDSLDLSPKAKDVLNFLISLLMANFHLVIHPFIYSKWFFSLLISIMIISFGKTLYLYSRKFADSILINHKKSGHCRRLHERTPAKCIIYWCFCKTAMSYRRYSPNAVNFEIIIGV